MTLYTYVYVWIPFSLQSNFEFQKGFFIYFILFS